MELERRRLESYKCHVHSENNTREQRAERAVVGGFLLGNNSTKGPIDTHICYY